MTIDVYFTPQDYIARPPSGECAVAVLDIFRATTSMVTAFANGSRRIIPVKTVEEALALKKRHPGGLLAGERQARPIAGFDLGNSPFEYNRSAVDGKTIIMTTTNGTTALKTAEQATKVYIGAFVNAAALCRILSSLSSDIVILCAGTRGQLTIEDALCAGLLADRLAGRGDLSDAAVAALAIYNDYRTDLVRRTSLGTHARYLAAIGYGADIDYCLRQDLFDIVPVFQNGEVTDPAAT
ncbi:2-phosphosulfolactate phosphatase [Anaeroselena agilis]|uniref:Probable 2-phosphosulfolactate phosphatase n=1 Tax=Anaeroselena agilis TaxID=3063788 RepID=A0ABU3NVQ0_9FIRM|nr:2-phosphosulfolactate phosphatase [Selenomonadales bacterium 4137-cl]